MLVIAGAGTGKTTVLTRRIARLIRECGVSPKEILAVTYSENSAREMRERVQAELRGTETSGLRRSRAASIPGSLSVGPGRRW